MRRVCRWGRGMVSLLLLFILVSCVRSREDPPRVSPFDVRVVGRGEVEVVCASPQARTEAPDVRYSTSPLTPVTWDEARAVGPWLPVTVDGIPKLRSSLGGLSPILHYLVARSCGKAFPSLSPVMTVLPLRETILHGRLGGHYFGHALALVGDFDGDGYGDLLVGAPWSDEGLEGQRPAYVRWLRRLLRGVGISLHGTKAGAAYLYLGGPQGPASTSAWTLLGTDRYPWYPQARVRETCWGARWRGGEISTATATPTSLWGALATTRHSATKAPWPFTSGAGVRFPRSRTSAWWVGPATNRWEARSPEGTSTATP